MCNLEVINNITPNRAQFPLLIEKHSTCNSVGDAKWILTDSTTEDQLFIVNSLSSYISSLNTYTNTRGNMKGYYQNGKSGTDYTWKLFTRSYIPWHINRRDEMHNLMNKGTFLKSLRTAQLAVVAIGCTSAFVLGVILAIMEIMNLRGTDLPCITGKGEEERARLQRTKTTMNYIFKLIQVPFQIWAIVLCGGVKQFLITVANRKCSNADTNEILAYLAKTLASTYSSTITALAILVILLLLIYFSLFGTERTKELARPQLPQ